MIIAKTIGELALQEPMDVLDIRLDPQVGPTAETIALKHRLAHVTGWWHDVPIGTLIIGPTTPQLDVPKVRNLFAEHHPVGLARAELTKAAVAEPWFDSSLGSYSVAVCTADRPESLERCLASLKNLDALCQEVIIVDNSRKDLPVIKATVEGFGFRYVREPDPGLDRARNRALLEASSDLVLFTDDDVEIRHGWDRWLVDGFRDPLVMATAGLVLPAALSTEAQVRSEQFCSHSRGFAFRVYNGPHLFPEHRPASGNWSTPGVGAAMAVRKQFALAAGGFPEELDAGMPTGTGGDTWMYRRVLDAGYRVTYEPLSTARHWHRDDDESLVKMFTSNATGVWALNWRTLWHDGHRKATLRKMRNTATWHRQTLSDYRSGKSGALPRHLVLAELKGVAKSPLAYRRSAAMCAKRTPVLQRQWEMPAPWLRQSSAARSSSEPLPSLAVVIPTRGRSGQVVALAERVLSLPDVSAVVVAVDGDIDGTVATLTRLAKADGSERLRVVELDPNSKDLEHGSGAGAARNAGVRAVREDYVLFLDDDVMVKLDDFATQHLLTHRSTAQAVGDDRVLVVGPALVDHRGVGSFGVAGRNWWVDHTDRLRTEPALGFPDVCTGNMSLPRSLFDKLGRFPEIPRREDWLFGLRAIDAGVHVVAAPRASVVQRDENRSSSRKDFWRDGFGDALILTEFPSYASHIDTKLWPASGTSRRVAQFAGKRPALFQRLEPVITSVVRRTRSTKLRRRSGRVLSVASYWAGASAAVGAKNNPFNVDRPEPVSPAVSVDLLDPSTPSEVASGSAFSVVYEGLHLATVAGQTGAVASPIWRVRRWLIDRFAEDIATRRSAGTPT